MIDADSNPLPFVHRLGQEPISLRVPAIPDVSAVRKRCLIQQVACNRIDSLEIGSYLKQVHLLEAAVCAYVFENSVPRIRRPDRPLARSLAGLTGDFDRREEESAIASAVNVGNNHWP